jgi:hypothetical protein
MGDLPDDFLDVTASLGWGLSTLKKMKIREEPVKGPENS